MDEYRHGPINTATHGFRISEHRQETLIAIDRHVAALAVAASKNEAGNVVID